MIRVLLVDDEKSICKLVALCLGESFKVDPFPFLKEAIGALDEVEYDVILLDLALPDSFGMETFDRMLEAAESLPIIVLTATENDEMARECIRKGAQDYIFKSDMALMNLARSISFAIDRQKLIYRAREAARSASRCVDRVSMIIGKKNV